MAPGDTATGVRTDSVKVNMQSTQPQQTAKVTSLVTGKYPKRSTTWTGTTQFVPGDSVVFRATIKNAGGLPLVGATARIDVTGGQNVTVLTGPSDANGVSEGIWKTSAPSRKSAGTPTGTCTGTVSGVTASGYVWDGAATTVTFSLTK